MEQKNAFLTPFVTRSHTGVYGIIRRGKELLLIKKARGPYTGLYDLPGGGPEAGETPEQTVAREIEEETQCRLEKATRIGTKTIFFSDFTKASGEVGCMQHTGTLFETVVSGEPTAVGDGRDSNGAVWVNVDELSSQNATPFALMAAGKELISLANKEDYPVDVGIRRAPRPDDRYIMIAGVLLFNSRGNLILHRISHHKKVDAGRWSYSAAGHVDAGETYEQAAKRELKEELGVEAQIDSFVGKTYTEREGRLVAFHHVFKVISDESVTPDPNEIEEIREWSVPELRQAIAQRPEEFSAAFARIANQL